MLSSNLQSILDNRARYLPEITSKAINSVDWPAKLIEIGKKYGMHIDEMEDFQSVVLRSMIGMITPEKFEDELISALALSPANAEKILNDVNDQILEPIHEFVLNKGAVAPDPLKTAGIHIDPAPLEATQDTTLMPEYSVVAPAPLEIPASPEPELPLVHGDFNDFFINPVVK